MNDKIQDAAKALDNANIITILTGAGVSKESGVPTFRDSMEGLWAKYNPEDLATPMAFKANPKLIWDWYEWRRETASNVSPNPGHYALAELEALKPYVYVVTQNVDDLHEQAGSTEVVHLHGNIATHKCFDDCQGNPTMVDIRTIDDIPDDTPPKCPHCNTAYVRPNVVWFSENLPQVELATAAAYSQECDVMLVIGTSGLVSPASQLPTVARRNGATIIEVNPDDSMITRITDIKLDAPSGEAMPKVIDAMKTLQN